MTILKLTNQDKRFYPIMGPYLANRQIEKEVGYQLYDDPGKVWMVAKNGARVIGFCYLWKKSKTRYDIGSCYAPKNGGVFTEMLSTALKNLQPPGVITISVMRDEFREAILKAGFQVKKELKNITEYMKEIPDEK